MKTKTKKKPGIVKKVATKKPQSKPAEKKKVVKRERPTVVKELNTVSENSLESTSGENLEPSPKTNKLENTMKPQQVIDIANFLADYKEPMIVNSPAQSSTPPAQGSVPAQPATNLTKPLENIITQATQPGNVPTSTPQPEIKYYRTGKKAGQPRPVKNNPVQPPVNTPPVNQTVQGQPLKNPLISGSMFLLVIDLGLPMIIVFINNRYSKVKMKTAMIKLNKDQKKDLEPLAEEVVRYLNITANPVLLFTISLTGCYLMNYQLQKSIVENQMNINNER